jgi:hypothetical protein
MEHYVLTWVAIDRTAEKLGVTEAARKKWRSRRVPWEWRIKIAEDLKSAGINVALADFDTVGPQSGRIAA